MDVVEFIIAVCWLPISLYKTLTGAYIPSVYVILAITAIVGGVVAFFAPVAVIGIISLIAYVFGSACFISYYYRRGGDGAKLWELINSGFLTGALVRLIFAVAGI